MDPIICTREKFTVFRCYGVIWNVESGEEKKMKKNRNNTKHI